MWHTVRVRSENCCLKITNSESNYDFLLTNLKCIWKNKLSESEITTTIHELNPLLEATPKTLVKKAIIALSERDLSDEIDYVEESFGITLKSESKIGGYPFKFNLKLYVVLHENFFHELTLPLVLLTKTLKERENQLIEIIRLKDKEIEDYRLGGAQLSHKILKTKPFDEKVHFQGTLDSEKICDVIHNPANYFASTLNELFDSATKDITKYRKIKSSSDGVRIKSPQHSPDLFDDFDEPEAKVMAVPEKVPNKLEEELKPRKLYAKRSGKPSKKLHI